TDADGNATLTDIHITHVDAQRGEMPGLDPRMNDFPYQITVINAPGVGTTMDLPLNGLKGDSLAIKAEDGTTFTASLTSGSGAITGRGAVATTYQSVD